MSAARSGLKALHILVSGDVQQVGYRRLVWRLANRMGIKGYVENLPDGRVRVVAEGKKKTLIKFADVIKTKEPPIAVKAMETMHRKPTGRFTDFRIKAGTLVEELMEGLGAGEAQLNLFRREFGDYQKDFQFYRKEFQDYREDFQDYRKEFQDYQKDFQDYRKEFGDYEVEFGDYRKEFKDYRQEFRDYRKEFQGFASRTDNNFKSLEARYGEISEKLTKILETLEKESMETRRALTQAMNALTEAVTLLKQR